MPRLHTALIAAAVVVGSIVAACKEDAPTVTGPKALDTSVDTIVVTPASWTATRLGQRETFVTRALDAQGNPVTGAVVTLTSSDPTVVSVDANGLATARREGVATLRAKSGTDSTVAALAVSVPAPPPEDSVQYTVFVALTDSSPVVLQNGTLLFSQTTYDTRFGLSSPWQGPAVIGRFAWRADHYAVMTDMAGGRGTVWLKSRISEWAEVATADAVDVQVERDWFVWLLADGSLRAKDTPFGPATILDGSNVKEFQLSGNRIGALKSDSLLRVKEGSFNAPWVDLASNVVRFHMRGALLAVLLPGGRLQAKVGTNGPWTVLADSGAADFKVSSSLIGMVTTSGVFQVKEGLNGPWAELASSGVAQFELEGDRILWRLADGTAHVKDTPFGPVTDIGAGIKDIRLQGNFVGLLTTADELSVKRGIDGPRVNIGIYPTLQQYRLIAAVPQRPTRTNTRTYDLGRAACRDGEPGWCYSPHVPYPVPLYARFCGAGHPDSGPMQDSARARGPLDGMDQLCRHHDSANSWYPNDQGLANSCVVRYGLDFAQLTRHGSPLARGSSAYDQAFDHMPDLRYATAAFADLASTCSDTQLNQFITATASQY